MEGRVVDFADVLVRAGFRFLSHFSVRGGGLGEGLVFFTGEDLVILLGDSPAEVFFHRGKTTALHGAAYANQLLVGQFCSKRVHVVLRWVSPSLRGGGLACVVAGV